MKYFIKIVESRWVSGSNTKMIHKDQQGRLFLGPSISVVHGKTVILEATDTPLEDGYYHIIKVIDIV
jgi:hypothetical protein